MLQKSTLDFLKKIKKNNNKEWMDANRKLYEEAKKDFEQFTNELITGLSAMGVELSGLTAKNCIFRINRDIRFSQNKDPYKTNFGAAMVTGGKKIGKAGYYFHLEPGGNSFIGGGHWHPDAAKLKSIRQEIDYNWKDFKKIIEDKDFAETFEKMDGERLVNPPKGYDASNPAIDYLKLKSFTVGTPVSDAVLTTGDLKNHALSVFKTMQPFIDFLNTAD